MARESWRLQGEYDPFAIHMKASDEQGHSWKARVAFPAPWAGWIQEVVEAEFTPDYRTTHDVIRDAVWHRLTFWGERGPERPFTPELRSWLSLERAKNQLAVARNFSEMVAHFRGELDHTASELHRSRDYEGLNRLLINLEDEVRVNFSEPYLSDLLDRINYWRKASQ